MINQDNYCAAQGFCPTFHEALESYEIHVRMEVTFSAPHIPIPALFDLITRRLIDDIVRGTATHVLGVHADRDILSSFVCHFTTDAPKKTTTSIVPRWGVKMTNFVLSRDVWVCLMSTAGHGSAPSNM